LNYHAGLKLFSLRVHDSLARLARLRPAVPGAPEAEITAQAFVDAGLTSLSQTTALDPLPLGSIVAIQTASARASAEAAQRGEFKA